MIAELSVHIEKGPSQMTLGGAFLFVNMYGGYVESLGNIHDFKEIAAIDSQYCPAYQMKNPHKTGGNGWVFSA